MSDKDLSQIILDYIQSDNGNLSNDDYNALYTIGYNLFQNGKYDDAHAFFRILTYLAPEEEKFWFSLATNYKMLKKYPAAIQCYSQAAHKKPENPYTHWHAAECFFSLGERNAALTALNSALEAGRNDMNKYCHLVDQLEVVHNTWKTGA